VRFIIRRDALTESINMLLAHFEVTDFLVTDPPIDSIIGRIFQNGMGPC